jgi:ABC-type uncharacterized transport system substrate-binding protein
LVNNAKFGNSGCELSEEGAVEFFRVCRIVSRRKNVHCADSNRRPIWIFKARRLKEIAPRTVRVSLLFNPATAVPLEIFMPSIQAAATSFAIQASAAPVDGKEEIEGVVAAQAHNSGGGLIVMPDAYTTANRELIIALAARYNVPTIYNASFFVKSGGLIALGSDFVEQFRQAAGYIDRVLKGEKPADLPVQQTTKVELSINLKTAKALNLTVPLSLLARAEKVIE